MQRRLITPYADAPDLSAYEDREWDSAVDCKSGSEADHSRCEIHLLKHCYMDMKDSPAVFSVFSVFNLARAC